MPRRITLTDRQKDALLRLPISQTDLLRHYTLSDEDLVHIRQRRRPHNRFGFALQLCALRYPGRILAPGELIPAEIVERLLVDTGVAGGAGMSILPSCGRSTDSAPSPDVERVS